MMKKLSNISAATLAFMVLFGCSNDVTEKCPVDVIPKNGYIFFDTEVTSRGTLIEERLKDNYGVLGYKYASDWSTAKVQATPNVFDDPSVSDDKYNPKVIWDGTKHSYTPLKQWQSRQKYSFFAYYPYELSPSAADKEGNPYVTYTLASRQDATLLFDVMTAQVIDTDGTSGNVNFTMKHRLSAIDVIARNFMENGISVEVSDVSIHFDNLLYDNVQIPLNYEEEPDLVYGATSNTPTATYPLFSEKTTIDSGSEATFTANGKSMIVIPQKDFLKGEITLTYKNSKADAVVNENKVIPFDMGKEIMPGRRYGIQLTFTEEDVTIAIVESEEWAEIEDIYHEFE